MRFLLRRPSPALVVSFVALIVALGGTSYAAFTLPMNSVGTRQIKPRAVALSKIAPSARAALKGNTGPMGPKGDKGDVGPSTAFAAAEDTLLAATPGTPQTLVTLNLPAGSFALFAKVLADNDGVLSTAEVSCQLDVGATVVDASNTIRLGAESSSASDRGYYVATGTVTLQAADAATLTCTSGTNVHYFRRAITAVQVGTIG
jgi:hypothetical protein